jgi:hypothetical protein
MESESSKGFFKFHQSHVLPASIFGAFPVQWAALLASRAEFIPGYVEVELRMGGSLALLSGCSKASGYEKQILLYGMPA